MALACFTCNNHKGPNLSGVDPADERVEVCHSLTQRQLIGSGGYLEGEQLLPGFRYAIANLFKEWDWE